MSDELYNAHRICPDSGPCNHSLSRWPKHHLNLCCLLFAVLVCVASLNKITVDEDTQEEVPIKLASNYFLEDPYKSDVPRYVMNYTMNDDVYVFNFYVIGK